MNIRDVVLTKWFVVRVLVVLGGVLIGAGIDLHIATIGLAGVAIFFIGISED